MTKQLGPGDDREMILSPELWPAWPLLPLKRPKAKGDWSEFGMVLAIEGFTPTTVVRESMYIMVARAEQYSQEEFLAYLNGLPTLFYDTVDALLADGWVVD